MILCFDTSGPHCAALVADGPLVLASQFEAMTKGQAERLFPVLQTVLQSADLKWSDLHRIAVGVGPGNFTGIRIAVAAARGLALSLDIPAIGVSGFEVAAFGQTTPLVATVCAPRDQVYSQLWTAPDAAHPPALSPQDAIPVQPACHDAPHAPLEAIDMPERLQRMAQISAAAAIGHPPPAPLYIRPADAALPKDPPPVILPGGPPDRSGR